MRKKKRNPVIASYKSGVLAGQARKKLLSSGLKSPEVIRSANGERFWLWVWNTELDKAQKILGIGRAKNPCCRHKRRKSKRNPRRRKNPFYSVDYAAKKVWTKGRYVRGKFKPYKVRIKAASKRAAIKKVKSQFSAGGRFRARRAYEK